MDNRVFSSDKITILDGGFGTMLFASGFPLDAKPELAALTHPEIVRDIHRRYAQAGADILCANTFGANARKLRQTGYSVAQVVDASVKVAKEAAAETSARVALDVGPLGELLEPAGTLSFEQAYGLFAEIMLAGQTAGADLVFIETVSDLYEAKAALLAAKENTTLPVLVSMTFEAGGRTFSGTPVEAMALTLTALGADALGINCSLGPAEVMPVVRRLCSATTLPVLLKPNAGLPDPATGEFHLSAEDFCNQIEPCFAVGVSAVGGCCGTTPETVRLLAQRYAALAPVPRVVVHRASRICSGTQVVEVAGVRPIGERINPTGKKKLKEALKAGDIGYVCTLAVTQQQEGAAVLDVNVGAPDVDEVEMLPRVVKAVQAVTDLPLQLDSANPAALEAALRVYNGKPIVNSTSGEREKLDMVLPLCKRYGAAVVGLTLDEDGIPATAEGRFAIAEIILAAAREYGIPDEDVYIDCLVMAASAEPGSAVQTLTALRMVKERLGLKTVLGVSNISFGLPSRPLINQTFLAMALQAGLDLPIMNPADEGMRGCVEAYNLLAGEDRDAKAFVAAHSEQTPPPAAATQGIMSLQDAVRAGLKAEAASAAGALLAAGQAGLDVINNNLMPALDAVGQGFENGSVFLPQLLAAAGAAGAAFDVIKASFGNAAMQDGPPVVVATVKGDIHDIGKNIVKVLLENYGFRVIDLGRDVPPQEVVNAALKNEVKLVGLSALMTTTLPAMEETIRALRAAGAQCKVVVGGAVLTEEYALKIGADYYAKDAKRTVDIAREIHFNT